MNRRKSNLILKVSAILLTSYTPIGFSAPNPASTDYVDQKIAVLQLQIASIPAGRRGPQGPAGDNGRGVPAGGTTGQVLAKASNSNYDTQWVNQAGAQYTIGQNTQGGVVFFVYTDSSNAQHALISATADEAGAYDQAAAVAQCSSKSDGGFSDWFLPNKAQIAALFNNRYAIDPSDLNGNGGFSDHESDATSNYWSSSAVSDSTSGEGWLQSFASGDQSVDFESSSYSVRCVRLV